MLVGLVMIMVKIQGTFVISIHSIFNFYLKIEIFPWQKN